MASLKDLKTLSEIKHTIWPNSSFQYNTRIHKDVFFKMHSREPTGSGRHLGCLNIKPLKTSRIYCLEFGTEGDFKEL